MEKIKTKLCKYCNKSSENDPIGHINCKLSVFNEIKDDLQYMQNMLLNSKTDNANLKMIIQNLTEENNKLKLEKNVLEQRIIYLENENKSSYNTSNSSECVSANLNNAIHINSEYDDNEINSELLSPIRNRRLVNNGILSSESSPDEKSITSKSDLPKRTKVPFQSCYFNDQNKSNSKVTKSQLKKGNQSFRFSFLQPLEKDPLIDYIKSESKENVHKRKIVDTSQKLNMSMSKMNKSKELRQTVLKFPKNTCDMENSILNKFESENEQDNIEDENETFCEDLIQPTPGNTTLYRSRINGRKSSPLKLNKNSTLKITEKSLKSEKNTDGSVICVKQEPDEIVCISDSPSMNFDINDDDDNSRDILSEYNAQVSIEKKDKEDVNNFLILSPIRKKADKAKQPGYDCPECEKIYKLLGYQGTGFDRQKHMNECSKHRKNIRFHETPTGFWNPKFTPTQHSADETMLE